MRTGQGSQRLVQEDGAAGSVEMAPADSEHPAPRRLPARESPNTPAHPFRSIITSMETGKLGRVCPQLASQDRATGSAGPRPGQRKSWAFLHLTQEPPCLGKVSKPPGHVPSWPWGGSLATPYLELHLWSPTAADQALSVSSEHWGQNHLVSLQRGSLRGLSPSPDIRVGEVPKYGSVQREETGPSAIRSLESSKGSSKGGIPTG